MLNPRLSNQKSHDQTLILDGYGASITVDRGHLVVKSGTFGEGAGPSVRIPRGRSDVSRLIVRSQMGHISLNAIEWCIRMNIPIAIVGSDSRLINCMLPDHPHDGPIKRAQAVSGITQDAVKLARWLLEKKIQSQIDVLEHDLSRRGIFKERESERAASISELRRAITGLESDSTLVALLTREALAAQSYWKMLTGTALPWPDWTKRRIPEHWTKISPRATGHRLIREATDPFNAMLNYGYTLLEVEGRIACAASGLDPDLGLLHVDDRLRESFLYDLIEPARAKVDTLTLEFCIRKGLRLGCSMSCETEWFALILTSPATWRNSLCQNFANQLWMLLLHT